MIFENVENVENVINNFLQYVAGNPHAYGGAHQQLYPPQLIQTGMMGADVYDESLMISNNI